MSAILAFMTSNPWRAIALGLGLLLAVGFGVHKVIVADWKSDLADEVKKHAACKVDKKTLGDALDAQNKAVKALKDAADKQAADAGERARRAKEEADKRRKREAADTRSGPGRMNEFMAEVLQ